MQRVNKRIRRIEKFSEGVRESIMMDLIDGWSTGDKLLDFSLAVSEGRHDVRIIKGQYEPLQADVWRHAGELLLVVQMSMYYGKRVELVPRTIYLGELRGDTIEFDIDKELMGIPVREGYLVYQEQVIDDEIREAHLYSPGDRIYVGPLMSPYARSGGGVRNKDGAIYTPSRAPCDIYFHPFEREELFVDFGITGELLDYLKDMWIRMSVIDGDKA